MKYSTYYGDSKTFSFPLVWDKAAFTPAGAWAFVFTAKADLADSDDDALFQKASGAGIVESGSRVLVSIVPDDTEDLAVKSLFWAVRGTNALTEETRTFASGKIELIRGAATLGATSIDVVTTEDPLPFARTAAEIHAATAKTTPVDADEFGIWDSVSMLLRKLSWAHLKTSLGLGTAATVNTGTTSGTIPVIGSGDKLPTSVIPAVNVMDTLLVANEAARLALSSAAALNVIVVDADTGKTWGLVSGGNPATSGDWLQLGDRAISTSDVDGLDSQLADKANIDSPSFITPNLGSATMNGNIVPDSDRTRDLGSSTKNLFRVFSEIVKGKVITLGDISSGVEQGWMILYSGIDASSAKFSKIISLATTERIVSLPDAAGTVSFVDNTETLTNKTLVAPILGTPTSGILSNCTWALKVAQVVVTELTADFSTAATIPYDASIPQSGEGTEYITAGITPTNASSTLEIECNLFISGSAGGIFIAALFKDSDTDAIEAAGLGVAGNSIYPFTIRTRVSAASTSARTYKLRVGSNGITAYVNRSSGTADLFGAAAKSRMIVREILP